ncbi:MAG: IclR family transcriptional regulator C-terminal domain-containing protein [Betaproteobacteria bacterium]
MGAQTVDRACAILKEVARAGAEGARMIDLCHATGLSRPTAHRILLSLIAAGFVRQESASRRYSLGRALFEIGLAAPSPIESYPEVTHLLYELAHDTQDTTYLMMRSNDDVVCAGRGEGAYPIKANIVSPGDRRPMAGSAAGLSLLAALDPHEADAIVRRSGPSLARYCRLSEDDARACIDAARRNAYILVENLVMDGVTAVGMAIPSRHARAYLAISVSAIASRITPQRVPELVASLEYTARRIAAIVGS